MKILFVHSVDDILSPAKPLRTPEQMQFGISYISSTLKQRGHTTTLIVLSRMLGKENLHRADSAIAEFSPDLICFTAVCTEYPLIRDTARYVKALYPHIFMLAGGTHVSLNPADVICDDFDALCVGEGEFPILELVTQMENKKRPSGIKNMWIKTPAGIEKNPTRPFIEDLDNLPFPDRDMWHRWIAEDPHSANAVLLGRGCPFSCTYCCNSGLRKLAEGPYVRVRSPANIVAEIKEVVDRFPHKRNIHLEVETIGAKKEWAIELCSQLETLNASIKDPISYITNLRITPNLDIETLFSAFKKGNINTLKIGLESGSERIRRDVLNRNYSNDDVIKTVASARRHGLKVIFYNLIGVPGEINADIDETVCVNRICQPDKALTHIFFPYPGTKLYSICRERGLLPDKIDTDLERYKATLDLPGLSKRVIQRRFVWFDYDVYRGHRPIGSLLAKVLVSLFLSNTFLHRIYRRATYAPFLKRMKKVVKLG